MMFLHLFYVNSPLFNSELVKLINYNIDVSKSKHKFIFAYYDSYKIVEKESNCIFDESILEIENLLEYLKQYDYIFFHSFNFNVKMLLQLNNKLLRKCNWICWGHDLYFQGKMTFKRKLYKKIKSYKSKYLNSFIYALKGDLEYFKVNYNNNINSYNVVYPMGYELNLFPTEYKTKEDKIINVMVGHSAFDYLNHEKCFEILKPYKDKIRVHLMVSYGDEKYKSRIIKIAKNIFPEVIIYDKLLPQKEYAKILNENIDCAIMNFNHQAAFGNILLLLYLGKTLYLSKDGVMYKTLHGEGLFVRKLEDISNDIENDAFVISTKLKIKNREWSKQYLDKKLIREAWDSLFHEISKGEINNE